MVFAVVFSVGIIVLLSTLRSPLLVWMYVAGVIGSLFVLGIVRLRRSATIAAESTAHLLTIADFLANDPGRDSVRNRLQELATPDDNSNVPEALSGLLEGTPSSSQTARAVAHSAFGHALSAVGFASFMRTALVLAGLFGTVLFFAFELTRPELLSGDLRTLMPGLQGALASTLSGIFGSVTVGWFANRVDALLDGLTLETEAFIGGPFLAAAADRRVHRELQSETELWEALRQEVASMVDRSVSSIDRMADDTHAYAASLQEFSSQIANLPQLRVPPELAQLENVVAQFSESAAMLNATVTPLLETVATLGVFAPAKMLEQLDGLVASSSRSQDSTRLLLERIEANAIESRDGIIGAGASLDAIPGILRSEISAVKGAVTGLATEEQVGRIQASISELGDNLVQVPAEIGASAARISEATRSLESVASSLEGGSQSLKDQVNALNVLTEQISAARQSMAQAVARLRDVQNWHRRADQAPLMKFLLLPLWRRSEPHDV
jgi:hypothetical protein